MPDRPPSVLERLQRFAGELKSSTLLLVVTTLFVVDLVIPDPLPFVDEIVLGLLTILIARWRERRRQPPAAKPPPKNVTPPAPD
jgi:Family of unknown function (DUF6116)